MKMVKVLKMSTDFVWLGSSVVECTHGKREDTLVRVPFGPHSFSAPVTQYRTDDNYYEYIYYTYCFAFRSLSDWLFKMEVEGLNESFVVEKPVSTYSCPRTDCNYQCKWKSNLKRHVKSHAAKNPPAQVNELESKKGSFTTCIGD